MKAGTSPSIAALPNGGFAVAFQDSNGILWLYQNGNLTNTSYLVMTGTSPSIAVLENGKVAIAFQSGQTSTIAHLYLYQNGTAVDTGQGMIGTTSPSIVPLPGGGYQIAYCKNPSRNLWLDVNGVFSDQGLGMNIPGTMYPMGAAYSNNVLATPSNTWVANNAIDGDSGTAYSSNWSSSSTPGSFWAFLAAWSGYTTSVNVNTLVLTARLYAGSVQAFPASYDVYLTSSSDNSQWVFVGTYTTQPTLYSQTVVIPLGNVYTTWGVLIAPTVLGTDISGSHYFQLADVQLGLGN
jgi:hypothetical protein